jgi:hypothetical protein
MLKVTCRLLVTGGFTKLLFLVWLGSQVRSGQVRSGQVRSGQVRSGQVRSGQVRSGQVRSSQVRLGPVVLCWVVRLFWHQETFLSLLGEKLSWTNFLPLEKFFKPDLLLRTKDTNYHILIFFNFS